ncbi:hypothetical protein [uncultured Roseibium sp.]|uniref:hypothetical protein n=1 Tax=uncultured Roseibium sp. TaxID=1936171 RepID=UPI0032169EFE
MIEAGLPLQEGDHGVIGLVVDHAQVMARDPERLELLRELSRCPARLRGLRHKPLQGAD